MEDLRPRYLVMVTSANNNKYYKQIPHGDTWTAEYGRVGASPQKAEYPMSKWDSKYREKIRKGYVDQTELAKDLIEIKKETSKSTYKEIENKVIAEIVERLQEMARQAIRENYSISSNKVTQAMVSAAQKILDELVSIKTISKFNEKLIELFTTIPRAMSDVSSFLATAKKDFPSIIKREQDLLNVMKGQVIQKKVEEDVKSTVDSNMANPITILEAMGLEMEECTKDDIKLIKENLGESKDKFFRAWKVNNLRTKQRFDQYVKSEQINNTKLLWHGSRNENWWSILNSGLVLNPANVVINGKMFGYGCYFAPKAQKSIGYTSLDGSAFSLRHSSSGFMALMEVAYGTPYDVYAFDPKYYNYDYEHLQKACPGANCLHAHAGTMLRNDEIIFYKEEQISIKYLVEIK